MTSQKIIWRETGVHSGTADGKESVLVPWWRRGQGGIEERTSCRQEGSSGLRKLLHSEVNGPLMKKIWCQNLLCHYTSMSQHTWDGQTAIPTCLSVLVHIWSNISPPLKAFLVQVQNTWSASPLYPFLVCSHYYWISKQGKFDRVKRKAPLDLPSLSSACSS